MSSLIRHCLHRVSSAVLVLGALGLALPVTHAQTTPFMYVTGRNQWTVDAVSASGVYSVFAAGNLLENIEGITLDSAGNLYVSNSPNNSNDSIAKITPAGVMSYYASFGTTISPTGLAFDSAGNLFVGSQSNPPHIMKVAPGGAISTFNSGYADVERPWGLTFDHLGNLYVASLYKDYITKFAPDGTASVFANLPANSAPAGLTIDSHDNLYVSFMGLQTIDKITPDGDVSTYFSGSLLAGAVGIGMADSGYLYAVAQGNNIIEITPGGASASVFTTLGNFDGSTQFLVLTSPAVYALPEPSTYAAIAGLAALGLAALRRHRAMQPASVQADQA